MFDYTTRFESFIPLADKDVPEQYQQTLTKYRQLAIEHDVSIATPVCYMVRADCLFQTHAPKDYLVFWVPRILNGSMKDETRSQQMEWLANLRTKLELPAHHMSGFFGQLKLVAGLIGANYKATGESIPLDDNTCTGVECDVFCDRLGFTSFLGGCGLLCYGYGIGDYATSDFLGVVALGVEDLGT